MGTPHLLQVSGLGPKEDLEKAGVPVVRDLPQVGKKFQDVGVLRVASPKSTRAYPLQHVTGGPVTVRAKQGWTLDYLNNPVSGLLALVRWLVNGTGPMSALGAPGAAFIRTDDKKYILETRYCLALISSCPQPL